MPNLYRVFTPVDNVDAINKISTFATDLGLPNYVRSDRAVNDLLVFTVNTNQLIYLYFNTTNDMYLEPVSSSDDMTLLSLMDVNSRGFSLSISEIHMVGYDDPKSMYILMKRSDGVWMQLCLGYCHPIGVHSGCFVASVSCAGHEGPPATPALSHYDAEKFPIEESIGLSGVQQPMFGTWYYSGNGGGYVNVDIGNNATEHWHALKHNMSGNCAACPILTNVYDYENYPANQSQTTYGWQKLVAARQGFGWNTHLISVPFLIRDPDGYWIPVGYAPNIRAVRSQQHTVFDKVTSAGEDYWIFPMLRHSTYKIDTISSQEYFWAFKIFTGQESPVLI